MSICTNYNVAIRTRDNSTDNALIVRPRCKQWDCPHCAEVNRKIWLARIGNELRDHDEKHGENTRWFFVTFTLASEHHAKKGEYITDEKRRKQLVSSLQQWRGTWDKLMKRLKRQYGQFQYLRVFEQHKDGTLHVHMLCNANIADAKRVKRKGKGKGKYADNKYYWHSDIVQKHLKELGLGYIHDVKPLGLVLSDKDIPYGVTIADAPEKFSIRPKKEVTGMIASYIGKYLTKDIQSEVRLALKHGDMGVIRVIATSQNWSQLDHEPSKRDWVNQPIGVHEAQSIFDSGLSILDTNRKLSLTIGHFGEWSHYPNPDSELALKNGQ